MRRAPSGRSITSPASLSTLRCCDTAGRLTGSSRASSPTALGRSARRSKIARLVGSPSAVSPPAWLVITYGKSKLTMLILSSPTLALTGPTAARPREVIGKYEHELGTLEGVGRSDVELDLVLLVLGYVRGALRIVEAHTGRHRSPCRSVTSRQFGVLRRSTVRAISSCSSAVSTRNVRSRDREALRRRRVRRQVPRCERLLVAQAISP